MMEQLVRFLPLVAQLLASPEVARMLPQILATATRVFPNVPEEQRPAAAATALDRERVKWIQTALRLLGASMEADGFYGTATKAAVVKFQQDHGLEADGWAGTLTEERLRLAILQGAG